MKYHMVCEGNDMQLSALPVGYHRSRMYVFMAKCYRDNPLSRKYAMLEWLLLIQAGA